MLTNAFRNFRALPFAVLLIFATALPVMAGPFEDAVGKFANDEYSDTEEAVGVLATGGNPLAYAIISALQDGRLMADPDTKKVYVTQPDGKNIDAATGLPVAGIPDSAAAVRLNNRLRRTVEAALGGLTLLSPDPAKRIQAAQSVFKTHDETMLPVIDGALQNETNKGAKLAFTEARAAILLFKEDATDNEKLEAIATIKARGDQEALALLTGLTGDQPPAIARAAANATSAIQSNLALWSTVQNAWYGLSLGSVLLLAAIGLAITFGVMGVINMAHGEMVMIGAYVTFVVQETIRTSYPGLFDYSLLIAVPLAFVVAGAIGILIERSIIRFLYGRPLETLLATWGLSLVLQQAVRTMFGPTNREVGNPSWMSGAFEIGQITITYNRLWILCFTLAVFAILLAMLRYTSLGLEMRAVTQNRRMAASMGIATSRVDALTFGLGSGDRRNRRRGAVADRQCQSQSRSELYYQFLHGGGVWRRRQSVGHAGRRVHPRHRQQVPGAGRRRSARQDRHSCPYHPVHSETPARPVRTQGAGGGSMMPHVLTRSLDRSAAVFLILVAAVGVLVPLSNLLLPAGSLFQVPTYLVALFGKYVCYAILALAIDLIWGYCGILSLGHGAFFALGGYAMGMYLMRQIGSRGVYGNPLLPDFMVFLNYPRLPWYWHGFDMFWFAALMVIVVPGLLAFCFGWLAFRSRVTGVYLSIITQAMTYALLLGFFRNDFGFGGNNGLTDFKDILGFNVQADGTRAALFALSCLALIAGFLICRAVVTSKLGKVLIAIRDAESRTRFLGYRVESYKLFVFTLSACMAGVAGALYVPQVGIINPSEFAPGNSIEAVIWVAVGGRGTLIGAALGAVVVNYAKTVFTSGPLAPYWLFMLGALFILVTLLLPKGIIGTFNAWWEPWKAQRMTANAESAAREDGVSEPNMAE